MFLTIYPTITQSFLRIFILSSCCLSLCFSKDLQKCKFEDTIDLSNAQILSNGSYLYDGNKVFAPDQVSIYDHEELYNGRRVPMPAHPRACMCANCIRFCCDPKQEYVAPNTRECRTFNENVVHDPYINVMLSNYTLEKRHATQDFTIIRGVPCTFKIVITHNSSKENDWGVFENGTLAVFGTTKTNRKITQMSRKYYCLTQYPGADDKMELAPLVCPYGEKLPVSQRITYVTMAISIPFLIATLIVYASFEELQNLHGKCFMSYLTSMTVGSILLCSYNLGSAEFQTKIYFSFWCQIMGFFGYFTFMCVFFWLNVISFDVWESFRRSASVRLGKDKRFLYYSAYAWGVPMCLTAIAMAVESSNVHDIYKPGIPDACWINFSKCSALFYYSGINLVIVLVDLSFFVMTLRKILTMKKDINEVMNHGNNSRMNNKLSQDKHSFSLYFRLFLIMGIIWIFDASCHIENMLYPKFNNPLYYITDVLNVLVGPLIFIFFILNRKVLGLLQRRYKSLRSRIATTEVTAKTNVTEEQMPSNTRSK